MDAACCFDPMLLEKLARLIQSYKKTAGSDAFIRFTNFSLGSVRSSHALYASKKISDDRNFDILLSCSGSIAEVFEQADVESVTMWQSEAHKQVIFLDVAEVKSQTYAINRAKHE